MLLFAKDWLDYPEAIIDTQTKNTSFLRYSTLLKTMGIKNHAFVLALLDPTLQGVDPFDPNLSIDQMAAIAIESKRNFFYYIREVARAPGRSSSHGSMIRANRGNIALYWLFFNHITTILIQIRQTGKSFSIDELGIYLTNIRCINTDINILTKDETLRAFNLERLKEIEGELPFYLKQRTRGDLGNTEELTVKALGNTIKAHLPNKSPKMALNVGRGLTSPIFFIDEAPFLPNIAISLPAALAAGTAARDDARKADEPYGTIITTTAGKKDDRDGRYIYDMLCNSAVWNEKFFDSKDLEELEMTVRKNSSKGSLRVNCTFNHRQLGYTDEWLKRAIEEAEVTGEDADRDFFNRWTAGSQVAPLPIAIMEMIKKSEVLDCYTEISSPYGYITRWYIEENEIQRVMNNDFHVLSIDSSDAAGGDDIALTLKSIRHGGLIAAGNYNETNLITFCEWLVQWFVRFDNFVLIIERRSTGAMILDYLILMLVARGIDPFKRIYNKIVNEADEYPDRFKEINKPMFSRNQDIYVQFKRAFGFATSANGATSRSELYSTTLLSAAKYTGDKVKDPKVVDQIVSLITKNGRVDHPEGGHDDMVISWLLSAWFLTKARHIDYYGINIADVLCESSAKKIDDDPRTLYANAEQQQLRSDIETLIEDIKKERDEYIVQKLEHKLRSLSNKLILGNNEIFSIDTLIHELKEQKNIARIKNTAKNYYGNNNFYGNSSYSNIGGFSNR